MSILHLKIGEQARVVGFESTNEPAYRTQLLTMGLTPGTVLTLSRIAPLGDPVEIQVRGYALSLRKKEAAILRIERVPL